MKKIVKVSLGAAMLFCATAANAKGVLVTAPAPVTTGVNQTIFCNALNLGTKPVDVTFEFMRADGTVINDPATPVTLDPGAATGFTTMSTDAVYCRFSTTGNKKKLRAVATYSTVTTGYTISIPAQ